MKTIAFFFLILLSIPAFSKIGTNKDYNIISQNDYNSNLIKGKDVILKRYIVVPDLNKNYKEIFNENNPDEILSMFSFMLNKNKSREISQYILSCDKSKDIGLLISGLYHFSNKEYSRSVIYLEKVQDAKFAFLRSLLVADCNYEMLVDKKNYNSILQFYQISLDLARTEQQKSIIKNRIRFIKYR
ncbi:MAG: hypothetical protein R2757_10980 [Draconibacterium sp.]